MCRGVSPWSSTSVGSQPDTNRSRQTFAWFVITARWRGVWVEREKTRSLLLQTGGKKKKKSLRRDQCAVRHTHLSLVVLYVEEFCVARQVNHRFDVVAGLVDDGQVEQPADSHSQKRSANAKCPTANHQTHIRLVSNQKVAKLNCY